MTGLRGIGRAKDILRIGLDLKPWPQCMAIGQLRRAFSPTNRSRERRLARPEGCAGRDAKQANPGAIIAMDGAVGQRDVGKILITRKT